MDRRAYEDKALSAHANCERCGTALRSDPKDTRFQLCAECKKVLTTVTRPVRRA